MTNKCKTFVSRWDHATCSTCGEEHDRRAPTPAAAPGLDLDAVEAAISDDQLSAWLKVAGAASPAALQYGASRGDGRAFILDAYDKGPAGSVHTVWYGDPDDALIVAVTGNGPTSEANAKHIAWSSPRNVTALIAEVRALRARLAEAKRLGREACGIGSACFKTNCDCRIGAIRAALEAL